MASPFLRLNYAIIWISLMRRRRGERRKSTSHSLCHCPLLLEYTVQPVIQMVIQKQVNKKQGRKQDEKERKSATLVYNRTLLLVLVVGSFFSFLYKSSLTTLQCSSSSSCNTYTTTFTTSVYVIWDSVESCGLVVYLCMYKCRLKVTLLPFFD